jgi:NADPH:quinone reductase-like Zn-dependent oxidoreductase/acyl carrier protein
MLPNNGSARFPYGLECAGVVRAVGSGVTGYVPGDEVIAYANGCFKAFAMAQTGSVVPKPTSLSMEQAATLPAAYLTAWYALKHVGRLAQGERVLVHSAAGGVGLAAVHVAKMLGAEVFATSGTEEKRDYLLNLGVTCVADSRNPGFGEMILDATAGNGVDVVVNSLGEAFTAESLSVLSRYGRFIELGKRAILANGLLSLRPFERQLTFSAVDVGPDMPNFSEHLKEVVAYVCSGELPPLPLRAFPASDPVSGFEYMARGQHIGKIVFTMDAPSDLLDRATYRPSIGRSFDAIVGLGLDIDTASTKPRSAAVEHPEPSSDLITETERGIARIWRDLLGVARVQRDDNFFDLNGDSLLAAQVISLVHRDLGVKLPFSAIFDAPTVESLARGIDRVLGHPAPPTRPVEIEEGVI